MLTYPVIDPVALAIGPLKIHWYGLTYLVGFAGAWLLGVYRVRQAKKLRGISAWTEQQVADIVFYTAMGAVIGGRVGYVFFYGMNSWMQDFWFLFKIWEGGMSFHGGLLGVLVAFWLFARNFSKRFFEVADFCVPLVPIGLGAGRLGNFINGELWGRATDVPWRMVFPMDPLQLPRHPSQLYQFALEGLVLFLVLWFFSQRQRPMMAVSGLFLAGYGLVRSSAEFFREPDAHLGFIVGGWITMGQVLSVPMILAGSLLLYLSYKNQAMQPIPGPKAKKHQGRNSHPKSRAKT